MTEDNCSYCKIMHSVSERSKFYICPDCGRMFYVLRNGKIVTVAGEVEMIKGDCPYCKTAHSVPKRSEFYICPDCGRMFYVLRGGEFRTKKGAPGRRAKPWLQRKPVKVEMAR